MTPDPAWQVVDNDVCFFNPTVIIDCWRIFAENRFGEQVNYIRLGHYHADFADDAAKMKESAA